jgi:hypothetical protein
MNRPRSEFALLAMLAGLIACGAHFTLLYAMTTLACLRPHSTEPAFNIRIASIAITAIVLGALAIYLAGRFRRSAADPRHTDSDSSGRFLDFVTIALLFLATIGILWVTLPGLMITDCRT